VPLRRSAFAGEGTWTQRMLEAVINLALQPGE
jgi:hypothetical protein